MLAMPFYTSFAQENLRDLMTVYEEESVFAPLLFLHTVPIELAHPVRPTMRLASLADFEQQDWPKVIRTLAEECGAELWALATEVSMRYRAEDLRGGARKDEEWLVYLVCHRGGMLVWGAPILEGRRLGTVQDLTGDNRLQRMLAHLSEAFPGEGN